MSRVSHHAAIDLGAESGRVILGKLEDGKIAIEEIHRFPNRMRENEGGLRWDLRHLKSEILGGLIKIGERKVPLDSVSCDSWGVDYVLIPEDESAPKDPYCYRDGRNERAYPKVIQKLGQEKIFSETGLQFMALNTLYQVAADGMEGRPDLAKARTLLPIADYVNHFLGGRPVSEVSLASTTQFYNPRTRAWARDLIEGVGFPFRLLPPIVPSGTPLGKISAATVQVTGLPATCEVVASCSHDTGAAVAAAPAGGKGWAYLSSGTWSLLGVEAAEPVVTPDCLRLAMTNEVGFGHTIRLLKNIAGLWLVQECRRDFAKQGRDLDYATLTKLAGEAKPLVTLLDAFLSSWNAPGEMTGRITAYARSTGQPAPASDGAFVRTCLESLALAYREVLESLATLTGQPCRTLHILGGGGQNRLLNQMAADATGCTVVAGPVEATAVGNLLVQAAGLGRVQGLAGIREVVRQSFPLETFQPKDRGPWEEAWKRFRVLRSSQGNPT